VDRASGESRAAFVDYIRLSIRLDRLERDGLDQGPEADSIRDAIEGPWYAMDAVDLSCAYTLDNALAKSATTSLEEARRFVVQWLSTWPGATRLRIDEAGELQLEET